MQPGLPQACDDRGRRIRWIRTVARPALPLAALLALGRCGGSPSGPGGVPPPVMNVELTCPANVEVDNVTGSTQVNYPAPSATGGVAPVTTTCNPSSGSLFPVGATTVTCTGTDTATPPRSGACTFTVTVKPAVPVLKATTLSAFGDSITFGENGIIGPPDVPCNMSLNRRGIQFVDGCNTYPIILENLLIQRYTSQEPVVINNGLRGETTGQGLARLPGVLAQTKADALLLLEGVNDLPNSADVIVPNLRSDIQLAKTMGLKQVFLATIVPLVSKPGSRFDAKTPGLIGPTNVQIRALAGEQGVPLADLEVAFNAVPDFGDSLLEDDGEHPTPAGYQLIAQTFFTAIQANLEEPRSGVLRSGVAPRSSAPSRPHVEVSPQTTGKAVGIRKGQQP